MSIIFHINILLKKILYLFIPKTILTRIIIITVLPIVTINTIIGYVFFKQYWTNVTKLLIYNISKEINHVMFLIKDQIKDHNNFINVQKIAIDDFSIELKKLDHYPKYKDNNIEFSLLVEGLKANLQYQHKVYFNKKWLYILISDDTNIIECKLPMSKIGINKTITLILWSLGSSIIIILLSLIFIRRQLNPLYKISQIDPYKENFLESNFFEGTIEIKNIASIIRTMHYKISKNFYYRNKILLSIAKDLQKPLSRIQNNCSISYNIESLSIIAKDLLILSNLIDSYISFYSSYNNYIAIIDIIIIIKDIVSEANNSNKQIIIWDTPDTLLIKTNEKQFRELLFQLLSNSLQYSISTVLISIIIKEQKYSIIIDNDDKDFIYDTNGNLLKQFLKISDADMNDNRIDNRIFYQMQNTIFDNNGTIEFKRSKLGGSKIIIIFPIIDIYL